MDAVEIIEVTFAGIIGIIEAIGGILLGKWGAKMYVKQNELKAKEEELIAREKAIKAKEKLIE